MLVEPEMQGRVLTIYTTVALFSSSESSLFPSKQKEIDKEEESEYWVEGIQGKVTEVTPDFIRIEAVNRSKLYCWKISQAQIVGVCEIKKSQLGLKQAERMRLRHQKKKQPKQ